MTAQCPKCGQFTRATTREGYDGTWNQQYVTTYCKQHGEITETTV